MKPTIVIDDFLSKEDQDKIELAVLTGNWKFIKDMSYNKSTNPSYGFSQPFKHPEHGILSPLYEGVCVPIINQLAEQLQNGNNSKFRLNDIYHARAFLQLPLNEKFVKVGRKNGVHLDLAIPHYAAVYYVNNSDGPTIIYEQTSVDTPPGSNDVNLIVHKEVYPKKGRIALFDGIRYHCSSQPATNYRCIINFNLV